MHIAHMAAAAGLALASAANAACPPDCPVFKLGIETTLTVVDGATTRQSTIYGVGVLPLSSLLDGGKGALLLGLSDPIDFGHPTPDGTKISALVGFTFTPSEYFTPATALAILPLRDAKDWKSPGGTSYRFYVPIPKTSYLPDPFIETDRRSVSGGLSWGLSLDGRHVTGRYYVHSAVPEPSSWMLMIAGFGLIGTALRRRAMAVVQLV